MNPIPDHQRRVDELKRAEALVDELHAGCCQPLLSPGIEKLTATLRTAETALSKLDREPDVAREIVALLEDAGAQLGYLQVACCSPARTKLYTEALNCLARTQRLISRTHDLEQ